jgi:hypothetical protein
MTHDELGAETLTQYRNVGSGSLIGMQTCQF